MLLNLLCKQSICVTKHASGSNDSLRHKSSVKFFFYVQQLMFLDERIVIFAVAAWFIPIMLGTSTFASV